jgi:hypothetical protein
MPRATPILSTRTFGNVGAFGFPGFMGALHSSDARVTHAELDLALTRSKT